MSGAEVWASPHRQGGQPCLAGTRMPTATIGHLMESLDDYERIARMYPHLEGFQIWDAVVFEALNGRGKKYRKRLRRILRERDRALREASARVLADFNRAHGFDLDDEQRAAWMRTKNTPSST